MKPMFKNVGERPLRKMDASAFKKNEFVKMLGLLFDFKLDWGCYIARFHTGRKTFSLILTHFSPVLHFI